FNYDLGEHKLLIKSIDSSDNEVQIEKTISIKHLLLKVPISNLKYFGYSDNYIVLNDSHGSLIDYQKAEEDTDIVIYGDGSIVDNFTASLFVNPKDVSPDRLQRMYSFGGIEPGTILQTFQEHLTDGNSPIIYDSNKQLDLVIDYPNPYGINGTGYSLKRETDTQVQLQYSDYIDDNFFLLSSLPFDPVVKEDYRYTIITDLEKKNYNQEDFLKPNRYYTVDIPESVYSSSYSGFYNYHLNGYRSESDLEDGILHNIIGYGSSVNIFGNSLDLPMIEEFKFYELYFMASDRENYEMSRKQRGMELKEFPDIDLFFNSNTVNTFGTYDYTLFDYGYYDVENKVFIGMQWFFYKEPSQTINIPYYNFEMPDAIRIILEDANVDQILDENRIQNGLSAILVKKEQYKDYRELMFQYANRYDSRGEWYALRLNSNSGSAKHSKKAAEYSTGKQSVFGL
ncbi:hypothetical protein LCGC14_1264250, partial [marine sediment metagenome]